MSDHVRFVMHKVALKQVFSAYFDFPLPILIEPYAPYSSSGVGTVLTDVPSELSLTPPQEIKKKTIYMV
jgi:hypothetical protein